MAPTCLVEFASELRIVSHKTWLCFTTRMPILKTKYLHDPRSDPVDKGKGKEKRPSEAKVESGSDPELEEALHMVTEDEERKAKLCCKRGEDALRFNIIPGMKERFFEGTHNWNFNKEKQVLDIIKIQDEMNPNMKKRKRDPLVSHPSETTMDVHSQAVDELVANAPPPSSATPVAPQFY
ncbi:hypothetical protein HAX54_025902 [Datura stramonium]|uniref:Uncharacterized protein n=1 Tax=Datura stramonium TaxID=4076 RepID=A0ABS8V0A5_DATST|nr:hypothetical protein [Datura stramonium]